MNNQSSGIIAIYGGAFDPVHLGHIKIALHILAQPEINQLRLLPCYLHPNKSKIDADATHRCNMLKLIAKDSLIIDRCELEREKISYTVDTAKHLREELGAHAPLALVLGLDVYAEISSWHQASLLPSLLHLIVVARPNAELDNRQRGWQIADSLQEMTTCAAGLAFFMSNPLVDVSSSQIREMIAQGVQPRYLLPATVWNYIKRNQLYNYKETP